MWEPIQTALLYFIRGCRTERLIYQVFFARADPLVKSNCNRSGGRGNDVSRIIHIGYLSYG